MDFMKLTVVGDGGVGKSCLLITYTKGSFPSMYVPTVFDNYCADVTVDGKTVSVALWDTAGQEDYDRLRPLSYPDTDVLFICYSVESIDSFENIESKWVPEVRHFCPDVPLVLVACKTDLRSSSTRTDMVTYKEGYDLAKRCRMRFCETSSLLQIGLKECFDDAIRTAMTCGPKTKKGGFFGSLSKKKAIPIPPVMPPAGFAPTIDIETSTFGDDWYKMIQDPKHCVVTFIVGDKHRLDAHKVILCAASKVFSKILGISKPMKNNQMKEINAIDNYSVEQLNSGAVQGIAAVYNDGMGEKNLTVTATQHTTIELSADISAKTFIRILEFLYSGVPRFPDIDEVTEDEMKELQRVAVIFKLTQLQTICTNISNEQDFLNPSIGTYLNDETGARLKEMFLNQPDIADVVFNVDGTEIYAHKCILSARCDVMSAMFSGNFVESKNNMTEIHIPNTTAETFLAFLEYIYTDHSPIEENDSVGIMVLADEYGQRRLVNLCELYITKEVDRSVTKQIEKSEIDVIGLLLTSQTYNSRQLANWCLFFISSNYIAFEQRKEFPQLTGENRKHVEENRWPPLSYLKDVQEYEKKYMNTDKSSGKCVVM